MFCDFLIIGVSKTQRPLPLPVPPKEARLPFPLEKTKKYITLPLILTPLSWNKFCTVPYRVTDIPLWRKNSAKSDTGEITF